MAGIWQSIKYKQVIHETFKIRYEYESMRLTLTQARPIETTRTLNRASPPHRCVKAAFLTSAGSTARWISPLRRVINMFAQRANTGGPQLSQRSSSVFPSPPPRRASAPTITDTASVSLCGPHPGVPSLIGN